MRAGGCFFPFSGQAMLKTPKFQYVCHVVFLISTLKVGARWVTAKMNGRMRSTGRTGRPRTWSPGGPPRAAAP